MAILKMGKNTDNNPKDMPKADEVNGLEYIKDSPGRSILKAISWRIIASGTTFLITFLIFSHTTGHTLSEALETAWYVTLIEFTAKILIYYLHERLWTNIRWGKYWRRSYWRRRRWKKLYRKMHDAATDV